MRVPDGSVVKLGHAWSCDDPHRRVPDGSVEEIWRQQPTAQVVLPVAVPPSGVTANSWAQWE